MLIDGKPFFEIRVKNKEEAYEQIIELSRNNDYATGIYWIMKIPKTTTN